MKFKLNNLAYGLLILFLILVSKKVLYNFGLIEGMDNQCDLSAGISENTGWVNIKIKEQHPDRVYAKNDQLKCYGYIPDRPTWIKGWGTKVNNEYKDSLPVISSSQLVDYKDIGRINPNNVNDISKLPEPPVEPSVEPPVQPDPNNTDTDIIVDGDVDKVMVDGNVDNVVVTPEPNGSAMDSSPMAPVQRTDTTVDNQPSTSLGNAVDGGGVEGTVAPSGSIADTSQPIDGIARSSDTSNSQLPFDDMMKEHRDEMTKATENMMKGLGAMGDNTYIPINVNVSYNGSNDPNRVEKNCSYQNGRYSCRPNNIGDSMYGFDYSSLGASSTTAN